MNLVYVPSVAPTGATDVLARLAEVIQVSDPVAVSEALRFLAASTALSGKRVLTKSTALGVLAHAKNLTRVVMVDRSGDEPVEVWEP